MSDPTAKTDNPRMKNDLPILKDNEDINNFADWEWKMQIELEHLKVWKYIEGPKSRGPPAIPALVETKRVRIGLTPRILITKGNEDEVEAAKTAREAWMQGDLTARRALAAVIPATKGPAIKHVKSAREIWKTLQAEYRPVNAVRAQTLYQMIHKLQCPPTRSVKEWVDEIRGYYSELRDQDYRLMSDARFASHLVASLPVIDVWRPFIHHLRSKMIKREKKGKPPLTSAYVIERIREENDNIRASDPNVITEVYGIQVPKPKRKPEGDAGSIIGVADASANKRAKTLLRCANMHCKRRGHLKEDCFAYGGGKVGEYPDWWIGPKNLHLPPNARTSRANTATATNDNLTANAVLAQEGGVLVLVTEMTSTDVRCTNAALENSTLPKDHLKFYHDSGANRHIAFERALFHNYKSIAPLNVNGFDNSVHSSAVGMGDLIFDTKYDGRSRTLRLSNVLHVPSARLNLISQGCLERKGIACRSGNGQLVLTTHGYDILRGSLGANNLFLLDVTPVLASLKDRISDLVEEVSGNINAAEATAKNRIETDFGTAGWGISA